RCRSRWRTPCARRGSSAVASELADHGVSVLVDAEQLLHALLGAVEAHLGGPCEPNAFFEELQGLLERQIAALEALDDLAEPRERAFERRRFPGGGCVGRVRLPNRHGVRCPGASPPAGTSARRSATFPAPKPARVTIPSGSASTGAASPDGKRRIAPRRVPSARTSATESVPVPVSNVGASARLRPRRESSRVSASGSSVAARRSVRARTPWGRRESACTIARRTLGSTSKR